MTSRRTSNSRTSSATPGAESAERSNSSSSVESLSVVAPRGDRRDTLIAARNRVAAELDDLKWSKHKASCHCDCGITDPRSIVALTKELRAIEAELAGLPVPNKKESPVDRARRSASAKNDELAVRRAHRTSGSAAS